MVTAEQVQTIFALIDEKGIRHDWFASQLGVKKAQLSRWKSGTRPVPDWFVARSCEILGVPESFVSFVAARLPDGNATVLRRTSTDAETAVPA